MFKQDEVKVWAMRDKDIANYREPMEKLMTLLHPREVDYLTKQCNPIKRKRSAVARYMIWRTLGSQLGVNWDTLSKDPPQGIDLSYQNVRWSVTHTEGLTMVAFILDKRVGIDVEYMVTNRNVLKIAERYFEEEERSFLFSCSPYLTEENFFRMWTTKEAYFKYRSFGNFYTLLHESCLYLQADKNVWGLKWERDFFFTVVTDKNPESNLEVKPFSEKLFE